MEKSLSDWSKIINFDLYPIDDFSLPQTKALIEKCQNDMKQTGACELPNFVSSNALKELQSECALLEKMAFYKALNANAYLKPSDPSLPDDHPINLTEYTNVGVVAYDQFPKESLLKQIYEYQPLQKFVGHILGLKEIYQYGDPMGALNLSVMNNTDYLRWHFDQTDFVTSLAIQSGERGGDFEYVPMIRTASQENYDEVKKLLQGDSSKVVHLQNKPGTFVLFQGRYSIHRVTPIEGSRPRWIGLFGYDSKPGVQSTPHLREIRYGRQEILTKPPTFEELKQMKHPSR